MGLEMERAGDPFIRTLPPECIEDSVKPFHGEYGTLPILFKGRLTLSVVLLLVVEGAVQVVPALLLLLLIEQMQVRVVGC